MGKTKFMAVNRRFGAFLTAVMKEQCITMTELRRHCHFDNTALSFLREA